MATKHQICLLSKEAFSVIWTSTSLKWTFQRKMNLKIRDKRWSLQSLNSIGVTTACHFWTFSDQQSIGCTFTFLSLVWREMSNSKKIASNEWNSFKRSSSQEGHEVSNGLEWNSSHAGGLISQWVILFVNTFQIKMFLIKTKSIRDMRIYSQ